MGRSRCNCRYFSLVHDISHDGPMRLEDERLEYKIIKKEISGGNDAGLYSHGWSLMNKSEDRPLNVGRSWEISKVFAVRWIAMELGIKSRGQNEQKTCEPSLITNNH